MNEITNENSEAFIAWAKENAIDIRSVDPEHEIDNSDLKAIASTIRDEVEIVALSEGCHNNKQMMSLHHRIIKYLGGIQQLLKTI